MDEGNGRRGVFRRSGWGICWMDVVVVVGHRIKRRVSYRAIDKRTININAKKASPRDRATVVVFPLHDPLCYSCGAVNRSLFTALIIVTVALNIVLLPIRTLFPAPNGPFLMWRQQPHDSSPPTTFFPCLQKSMETN